MSFIDSMIAAVSPKKAYEREAWRQGLEAMRGYDAAGFGRINSGWRAHNESAEITDRYSRDVVRARARDLERNSDILQAVVLAYKRNVVGKGFTLRARTGDDDLNRKIEKLWRQWCKARNCDVTGEQSFTEILRMAVERKKVDGGILFLFRHTSGGVVPFKLQAIEVDELDVTQSREMSDMSHTITRIRDVNEFINAVSVKERIAACLAVLIKKTIPTGTSLGRSGVRGPDGRVDYAGKKLGPGMIMEMGAGDEAQVVDPKGAATDATAFLKVQQGLIGAGQGLSYEAVSRDMSGSTYSSARQNAIEDEDTYAEDTELLTEFMSEVYEQFIISCYLSGVITFPGFWDKKAEYMAHDWVKSPKKWIDPAKESTADKTALQSGQKTYQEICAERGKDWRQAIDETAEVLEYGREKGIEMGGVIFGNGTAAAQQNAGGQPPQG